MDTKTLTLAAAGFLRLANGDHVLALQGALDGADVMILVPVAVDQAKGVRRAVNAILAPDMDAVPAPGRPAPAG
jgi:hypothetical protein